jgi:hypothetical protein
MAEGGAQGLLLSAEKTGLRAAEILQAPCLYTRRLVFKLLAYMAQNGMLSQEGPPIHAPLRQFLGRRRFIAASTASTPPGIFEKKKKYAAASSQKLAERRMDRSDDCTT